MSSRRLLLAVITGLVSTLAPLSSLVAQQTAPPTGSPTVKQNKIPTAFELGHLPRVSQPRLSKNGDWLAMFGMLNGQRTLMIENLDDKSIEPTLVQGPTWRLNWYNWLADDRLLVSVSTPDAVYGTPVTVTRLALVNPRKQKARLMFVRDTNERNFQIQDQVVSLMPDDPHAILVSFNPNDPTKPQVRRASLSKRNLSKRSVQKHLPGIQRWFADRNGVVRAGVGFTSDQSQPVLKMKGNNDKWQDFSELYKQTGFNILGFPTDNLDIAYVNSDHEYPLGALYEYDLAKKAFTKMLAQHDNSAIDFIQLNEAEDAIVAVHFSSELVETQYLDTWTKEFSEHLANMLPDTNNYLVSVPSNHRRAIIYSYNSDIDPHFYLYDAERKRVDYLASAYPTLQNKALAKTFITEYEARDSLQIPAYVTLPAGISLESASQLPFVVLPHGGPHARDFLRFDWLTQAIASQGYGVLQMNFRGSTGYGAEFFESGAKQWGQAMQDDITDGTLWLAEQGWADPKRICITGASYGGYAALMGVVKEPDLYRCAIGLNGVYDIPDLLASEYKYVGGRFGTRFIGKLWKDRKSLRANSPARRASAIKAPVLLVHGTADRVVNYRQSRTMRNALVKAKAQHELIELPDGDHHLSIEANRLTFTKAAIEFLNNHLRSN